MKVASRLNVYQHLEQALDEVAQDWSEEMQLNGEAGTRDIHLSLARTVLLQAFGRVERVPKLWCWGVSDEGIAEKGVPTGPPYAGVKIMALHTYHSALAAGYYGLNKVEMEKVLRHPLSYEPIKRLTDLSNMVALPVERLYGLNHTRICDDGLFLVTENRYAIEDGTVVMPRLQDEILFASREVLDEEIGEDSTRGEINKALHGKDCLAEKAGVLKDIHSHIITICIKDTRLAVASLQRGLVAKPS